MFRTLNPKPSPKALKPNGLRRFVFRRVSKVIFLSNAGNSSKRPKPEPPSLCPGLLLGPSWIAVLEFEQGYRSQ